MQIKKSEKILQGQFAFKTDVGRVRLSNEDQATAVINAFGNVLLIVCDGMGGQSKGDLASTLAINYLTEEFKKRRKFINKGSAYYWLLKTIRSANTIIFDEASSNPNYHGMGTTLSAALIYQDTLITAQIGDSRIYLFSNHKLSQISDDQTYVGYLYRTGQISQEEMKTHPDRHVLMNALGIYPSVDIDAKMRVYNNETLLLCSDGLYNNANNNSIENVLNGEDSPEQKINELISIANNNGGSDNIGIALWESKNYVA